MSATKFLKCSCRHCGGRIEYPAEAAGLTLDCPHCAAQTELIVEVPEIEASRPRRTWLVWTGIGVLLVLVGMTAWVAVTLKRIERRTASKSRGVATTAAAANATAKSPLVLNNFEISDVRVIREGSLSYVVGTLKNTLPKQRFSARAEVELLDEAGRSVGLVSDYAPSIEPHGEWRFRALILKGAPAEGRITRIREQQ